MSSQHPLSTLGSFKKVKVGVRIIRVYTLCVLAHYNFAAYSFFGSLHNEDTHYGKANLRMVGYFA